MKKDHLNRFSYETRSSERAGFATGDIYQRDSRIETLEKTLERKRDVNEIRFCEMIRENGWLTWRTIKVEVKDHPDLNIKTK